MKILDTENYASSQRGLAWDSKMYRDALFNLKNMQGLWKLSVYENESETHSIEILKLDWSSKKEERQFINSFYKSKNLKQCTDNIEKFVNEYFANFFFDYFTIEGKKFCLPYCIPF